MSAGDAIERAMEVGLDAICVTDHQFIWGAEEAQELSKKYDYRVFRGVEVHTSLGDILVYGVYRDFAVGMDAIALCHTVADAGGVAVLAHPYRGGGTWGIWRREGVRDAGPAWEALREMVSCGGLQAIEVCNGHDGVGTEPKARGLAERLGLPSVASSDGHVVTELGTCATRFEDEVITDEDLVEALRKGHFEPVARQNGVYGPIDSP